MTCNIDITDITHMVLLLRLLLLCNTIRQIFHTTTTKVLGRAVDEAGKHHGNPTVLRRRGLNLDWLVKLAE